MIARLFFFGRTPELSLAELQSFAPSATLISVDIARVDGEILIDEKPTNDTELMDLLGGTVKIATYVTETSEIHASTITDVMDVTNSRKTFGISGYGISFDMIRKLSGEIKDLLSDKQSVRFVLPKDGTVLSSVVVEKERVEEFDVIRSSDRFIIARTTAVQPFENWSKRDYDRPYADAKSGMLPPKVARMIVNIALGANSRGKTLFDPFCGMGTVLGEALLRHVSVIGGDIDAETVRKAQKNIEWLKDMYSIPESAQVMVADATHSTDHLKDAKVDAIATEPFLGTPKIGEGKVTNPSEIADIIKGLDRLYIGCLKEWASCLIEKGVVVIAMPSFHIAGRVYSVKKVVDTCEKLGYTKLLGPIAYGRPQAIVQRNFYIFQKN